MEVAVRATQSMLRILNVRILADAVFNNKSLCILFQIWLCSLLVNRVGNNLQHVHVET